MKNRKVIIGMVSTVLVVGTAALWLNRERSPSPAAAPSGATPPLAAEVASSPRPVIPQKTDLIAAAPTPAARPAPVTRIDPPVAAVMAAEDGQAVKILRVRPDQVLAAVNGVSLTLKDLALLEGTAEQTLSPEMYDSLLDRAIARELAFQTAKAQQVALTGEQQERLKEMRAALEKSQPGVTYLDQTDPSRLAPDKVEFELRDAAGQMLQANLAAQAGLPSPFVNAEQVQQYYVGHKTEYGELPFAPADRDAAWSRLDAEIRAKLSPAVQAEYKEALRAYLERIKGAAQIVRK